MNMKGKQATLNFPQVTRININEFEPHRILKDDELSWIQPGVECSPEQHLKA